MMLAMGQADVLIAGYMEVVRSAISGNRGILMACIAGILSPASGIPLYPVAQQFWAAGVGRSAVLAFVISSMLLNWQSIVFRQPYLGWPLMLTVIAAGGVIMTAIALILPLLFRLLV